MTHSKKNFISILLNIGAKYSIILLLSGVVACKETKVYKSPPGYDLSSPEVYKMPAELNEISGITFINGNADTLYAEQDEEGKLFHFHPGDEKTSHVKFAKKGDYEDLAVCNGVVIILRSNGKLLTFLLNNGEKEEVDSVNEFNELLPGGEYESMYADEKTNRLYVLCKDCKDGKNMKLVNGYSFKIDATGTLTTGDVFSINEKEIEDLSNIKKINLKASAMAKNDLTQEWYIISAVNKMLVVTDAQWKVKSIYTLAPSSLFTQPEGIAFDSNGNLYISNEKGTGKSATILKFPYKQTR